MMRLLPGTGGPDRSRWRALLLLATLPLLGLAACSDDSDDEADAPDDTEDTSDAPTDATEPIHANICDDVPATESETVNEGGTVGIIDFEFCEDEAQALTIESGQSVRFTNYGGTDH